MNTSNQGSIINVINVFYKGLGSNLYVGKLIYKNRKIFFEYDADFIKYGLELSPFNLPLQLGVIESKDRTFNGLFGVFNDSLPDGWGRLLLDRKLMSAGFNPRALSPLDRLCFVGSHGMGALTYEPENPHKSLIINKDLDEIEVEVQATLNESDVYLDDLITLGGSSTGARPKILMNIENSDWLIKFRSALDPKDVSAIEYSYHLMAKESGLILPEAKLFPSKNGLGFFGVKRFDRKNNERIHMHTMSGLLNADHNEPSLDYETIMKATLYLTKDTDQCEIQFRNAVFNVLSHNRDDHAKNFSFLMDKSGSWTVSPAYDLTYSSGPAGEHSTMVIGEGKSPTKHHLLKLASIGGINQTRALEIINQVDSSIQKWTNIATNVGVSKLQIKNIENALENIRKKSGI